MAAVQLFPSSSSSLPPRLDGPSVTGAARSSDASVAVERSHPAGAQRLPGSRVAHAGGER